MSLLQGPRPPAPGQGVRAVRVNDRTEIAILKLSSSSSSSGSVFLLISNQAVLRSHSEHLQPDSEYNSKQALATVRGCILDLEFMARFD